VIHLCITKKTKDLYMSINRHNNTPASSPRSIIANIQETTPNNPPIQNINFTPLRSTRNNNLPVFSPIERTVAGNLTQEFSLEVPQAPRYNLRSQNHGQEVELTQREIPQTLSEEFQVITRNARRQARHELAETNSADASTHSNRNQSSNTTLGTITINNMNLGSDRSIDTGIFSNTSSSNASSIATIYPIDESPVTQFNTSPALLEASVNILERLSEQQGHIGLNEEHYLGLSNNFGIMHRNATMTADTITQRLNALFDNPITQEQHRFLGECQTLLNPPATEPSTRRTPPNSPQNPS
jgi:hypothetical protein